MKRLIPILLLLLLAGCKSQSALTSIQVDTSGSPPVVMLALKHRPDAAPTVSARLFPKYESTRMITLPAPPTHTGPGSYTITLPELPPNQYRLVIEIASARSMLGMRIGSSTQRVIHDFVIHDKLPAACFLFDKTPSDTLGWTARGVYLDNHAERISADTCPGIFHVNISWPHALNTASQGGSLFVPVSSECFPPPSARTSDNAMWRFSIVSPELTGRNDWQGLRAIQFKMATKTIPVIVVPEIEYRLKGQTLSTRVPGKPEAHYQVSSGRWGSLQHPVNLPASATISRVVFHLYGQAGNTATNQVDSIFLDAVCPAK